MQDLNMYSGTDPTQETCAGTTQIVRLPPDKMTINRSYRSSLEDLDPQVEIDDMFDV